MSEMLDNVKDFIQTQHHALPPYPGVRPAMQLLCSQFSQQLVTSRSEDIRDLTVGALKRHGFDQLEAYHFTNGFTAAGAANKRTKSEVCYEIGAVALAEDAPVHALEVARNGIQVFLPDRPWNQLDRNPELDHPRITRFHNYKSLPALVHEVLGST